MKTIDIAGHKIGPGAPCFIIAEAGVNHNGSVEAAFRMVDAAAEAGADAVKFQTYKTDAVYTAHVPKAAYMLAATKAGESMTDMARKLELPYEVFRDLFAYCTEKKILFLSSPFDEGSAVFLAELGVAALKIPSGELVNIPFLDHVARLGLPLIVSTGMATLQEVETAMETFRNAGNTDIVLLHCVSNYPADPADANLRAMQTLSVAFDCPVGFSDHTLGHEIAVASVALGASVLEKHFTLDRSQPGPDHQASMDPAQLAALVHHVRQVEAALGTGLKKPAAAEAGTAAVARKSLVAAKDIPAGAVITREMLVVKRPGTGLPSHMMPAVVGRKARVVILEGTLINMGMLA